MRNPKTDQMVSMASFMALMMLLSVLFAGRAQAENGVLPDLTELPAMVVNDAHHSVQLGVARAGDRLVSVGEQGIVLLSEDHGETWSQSAGVPVSVTLTQVEFVSDTRGWAIGHSGVVLRTDTAGDEWTRVLTGSEILELIKAEVATVPEASPGAQALKRNASYLNGSEPLLDIHITKEGEGWILGAYGIALRTSDYGETWESGFASINNPNSSHVYQLVPSPGSGSLMVGERGFVVSAAAETDTYEPVAIDYQGTFFGGVALSEDDYLLFGLRGNVWRSSGEGWESVNTGTESSFNAAIPTPLGIVLGDVSGRLFLYSEQDGTIREFAETSDAAVTDLILNSRGELVMTTGRGLKLLGLDNTAFK